MIDFAVFNTGDEKLIAYFLSNISPLRQNQKSQMRPRVCMQTKEETLTMLHKNAFFRATVTNSGRASNLVPNGEAMIEYYGGTDKMPKTYIKVLEASMCPFSFAFS